MQKTLNTAITIASIITPPGNSGVGIIRLSGPKTLEITNKMFTASQPLLPRYACLGTVNGKNFSDTALAIYFKAPNSFTGEDTTEFQCHGGYFLLQKVLDCALSHGATMAEPGEFSRRAFLNGKMSLDQAESIIDIIHAESDLQLSNANKTFSGVLRDKLNQIENELVSAAAQIEATLDYPEHDIEHTTAMAIRPVLEKIRQTIKDLTDTAATGRIVAHGIHVAVLGKPNAGKSSIFNALLNTDRSIVTNIAGTTTDTITESIHYNGIKITFHDTAGLRQGKSEIEALGIERSKKAIEDCDIALIVLDASDDQSSTHLGDMLALVKSKPYLVVYNKSDLKTHKDVFSVSAKTGQNIAEIKKQIYNKVITSPIQTDRVIITNTRHANELSLAAMAVEAALHSLSTVPLDCTAADVSAALSHIGNITGTHTSEAILDQIFSRFCLGK